MGLPAEKFGTGFEIPTGISQITYEYLRDWRRWVHMPRAEGLLEQTIFDGIARSEKMSWVSASISLYAKHHKLSKEEYLRKAQERLIGLFSETTIFHTTTIATVEDILTGSGRLKSMFETGRSAGGDGPKRRMEMEWTKFGFPQDGDATKRPIYGTLSDTKGTHAFSPLYGNISIKFKSAVRTHATFTGGDPYTTNGWHRYAPSPVAYPHFSSILATYDPLQIKRWSQFDLRKIEVQIHGGVDRSMIEAIYIKKKGVSPEERVRLTEALAQYNKSVEGKKNPIRLIES